MTLHIKIECDGSSCYHAEDEGSRIDWVHSEPGEQSIAGDYQRTVAGAAVAVSTGFLHMGPGWEAVEVPRSRYYPDGIKVLCPACAGADRI